MRVKVESRMAEAQKQMHAACAQVAQESAAEVAEAAKSDAPVKTGRLRDSIHTERGASELEAAIVVDAPYGIWVEFGTHLTAPTPFLTPAIFLVKRHLAARLKEALPR